MPLYTAVRSLSKNRPPLGRKHARARLFQPVEAAPTLPLVQTKENQPGSQKEYDYYLEQVEMLNKMKLNLQEIH